jgi:hypothetical protein
VESFPDRLDAGKLYVSIEFATVAHSCACGCKNQVITPLSPADWQLTFDGETISLRPSVGNWSFDCQSHYWIEKNKVHWASQFSRQEVDSVRAHDRRAHDEYYFDDSSVKLQEPNSEPVTVKPERMISKIHKWLKSMFRR